MATFPQAAADQGLTATDLQHQDRTQNDMGNLPENVHQLMQGVQNINLTPAPATPVAQPILYTSRVGLPEKFGGNSKKMRTFIAQCELYMRIQPVAFRTDRSKVSFILSLLKASAAQWARPIMEHNDPIMDNYQNFMDNFRDHFRDPVWAFYQIQKLHQGNKGIRRYIDKFKLLTAETDWSEAFLIRMFRKGLDPQIEDELRMQGVPQKLDELYQRCIFIESFLAEIQWFFRQPEEPSSRSRYTGCSLPTAVGTELEEEEPMPRGARRRSAEERQRRRDLALCFYCGESGHMVRTCPTKPS
ncbi:hypothetical protein E2320_017872 [Naja naja]|nr:hypothetical protein E2320_017872 [Naja naja]